MISCYLLMKNVVTRCKMQQFLTESWNFAWSLIAYSLVTGWLLIHALLQLFTRFQIKGDNNLDKNAGVLIGRCYFLLPL